MKHLILTQNSVEYAQSISEELWKIRKPASHVGDVTNLYCGYITHSDGRVALAFPDETLKIHQDANMQPLIDLITQGLTEQQASGVADHINGLTSQGEDALPLTIDNVLPSLYSDNLKEHSFMESDGWFNANN